MIKITSFLIASAACFGLTTVSWAGALDPVTSSPNFSPDETTAAKTEPTSSRANFLITGLHCPPCTSTVEGSLRKAKGVKSIKVDWQTKNAVVEFDERVISAQKIANAIATTPHMMGGGMKYSGWLAIKVAGIETDETAAKAKDVLGKVKGVAKVAVYPKQDSVGVAFAKDGGVTMKELLAALNDAGLKAESFADKQK